MGSQSRIFPGRRRPDSRAIPGCLPLRAEGATAPATNRRHQVDSGPSSWASSRHTQATTSSRSGRASPAKRPLRPGQQTGACASRGHGTSTREGTAPASPLRPPDRPGWPHTSQRTGARPRKTPPGNVLLRGCKGASSRTRPKMPASPASPAGRIRRALTPSPGCGPHPGRHIQTAGHDFLMPLPGPGRRLGRPGRRHPGAVRGRPGFTHHPE